MPASRSDDKFWASQRQADRKIQNERSLYIFSMYSSELSHMLPRNVIAYLYETYQKGAP